jgi:hypothetical protein
MTPAERLRIQQASMSCNSSKLLLFKHKNVEHKFVSAMELILPVRVRPNGMILPRQEHLIWKLKLVQ